MEVREPITIADLIAREYGGLVELVELLAEGNRLTRVYFELMQIDNGSIEVSATQVARAVERRWAAGKDLHRESTFRQWVEAYVRVAALLADLTVVGVLAEVDQSALSDDAQRLHHVSPVLQHDVSRLSERLKWLNPVLSPWTEVNEVAATWWLLDELVRQARRPQPPADGLAWPEWQRRVLMDAG
jgi:hypothetical protein